MPTVALAGTCALEWSPGESVSAACGAEYPPPRVVHGACSWRLPLTVVAGSYRQGMAAAEPPDEVRYDLEESLDLLAALEDARDALTDSDHLAVQAQLEHQIAALSRKLGFSRPSGGEDGR